MKSLHNFNALQSQEMEWVVGGMNPITAAAIDVVITVATWEAGSAVVEKYKEIKEENKNKTEDQRIQDSINDLGKAGPMY